MKTSEKIVKVYMYFAVSCFLMILAAHADAKDLLGSALQEDVADTFGTQGIFWKVFILVDVILATALAVKSKNPMVFLGVAAVAFVPAFLIKTLVF